MVGNATNQFFHVGLKTEKYQGRMSKLIYAFCLSVSILPALPLCIYYYLNSNFTCYNFNIFFLAFHLLDTGIFCF